MLLDNFYSILSSESSHSTTWTIQIELNPDHTVYQGHFPEHPVVPGVCLLQLIKECAENIRQLQAEGTVKEKTVNKSIVKEDIAKEEIVKENTGKESIIKEENIKDECFIKLKAALTPKA